jgi:uncharacterized protein with HEPN domain
MREERIVALVEQIMEACRLAASYVDGLDRADFLADKRTQQAVAMNLVIIGEAATRLELQHADFPRRFPEIPWQNMRGMRNRIAHGYFELDLGVVFDTASEAIPALMRQLPAVHAAAASLARDPD